ncbi:MULTISPECIES: hypothetical protein [unclassified Streptomyces]|uniref:hypothetical protein n=1 Tax=unclassified Streptomyces TaxID=2593676 RepID=UPI003D7381F8
MADRVQAGIAQDVKYCDRCGRQIEPEEDYDIFVPDSGSGTRPAVHTHRHPCTAPTPARTCRAPRPRLGGF